MYEVECHTSHIIEVIQNGIVYYRMEGYSIESHINVASTSGHTIQPLIFITPEPQPITSQNWGMHQAEAHCSLGSMSIFNLSLHCGLGHFQECLGSSTPIWYSITISAEESSGSAKEVPEQATSYSSTCVWCLVWCCSFFNCAMHHHVFLVHPQLNQQLGWRCPGFDTTVTSTWGTHIHHCGQCKSSFSPTTIYTLVLSDFSVAMPPAQLFPSSILSGLLKQGEHD